MTLTCGLEQKIQILSVMYGYPAGQTCPFDEHPFICQSHNKEKVVSICNGLSTCDITVDSNAFENPCRNPVWKLATVHYKCLETVNAVFAMEGMAMTLKCNGNERIKVVSGTYSRLSSAPNNVDVTETISKRCNNQRSCTWEVRKSQIGKQSFKEQILAESQVTKRQTKSRNSRDTDYPDTDSPDTDSPDTVFPDTDSPDTGSNRHDCHLDNEKIVFQISKKEI
ncbi:rhamnose-binding lectin [Biomphalaria pfeifferi]|uniref:Rhamnose-binding lectin n=1 Tax=Biomphalaria pfeifferi TaxID=112525 RepID=A0AAD8CA41_BIOPF|nr:rhamnose-binding lectin [Biomphalaria pfeifferi]